MFVHNTDQAALFKTKLYLTLYFYGSKIRELCENKMKEIKICK